MHAITKDIDSTIDRVITAGLPVTVGNVRVNLTRGYSPRDMFDAVSRDQRERIIRRLKQRGYMIGDETTRERIEFESMTPEQVAVQVEIDAENEVSVRRHRQALARTQKLLEAKQQKLGRPVTVGEFKPQIETIYARVGLASPFH